MLNEEFWGLYFCPFVDFRRSRAAKNMRAGMGLKRNKVQRLADAD
jgi:hypothetical protein